MANTTFTPEQIAQILEEFFNTVGTRQYIGPRIVPLFGRKGEDSIEWDNTGAYEPLTVVLYQGNSYTSRQYVPVGVEITNQAFWAITGNFNAQVEQYRRETAAAMAAAEAAQADIDTLLPKSEFSSENTVKEYIDTSILEIERSVESVSDVIPSTEFDATNTVKDYIDAVAALLPSNEFTSVSTVKQALIEVDKDKNRSYVGNYGAVENSPDNDWAAIVAAVAEVSDTIYFGSGKWDVGSGIFLPATIQNVSGNGATLYCSQDVDYLMTCNGQRMTVAGMNFNGNGRAKQLLNVETTNPRGVINCHFYNIGNYVDGQDETQYNIGLEMTNDANAIGLVAVGCSFGVLGDITGGVGIKTHTDNQIVGCKFFRMDYAILARGCNIGNCYFWTSSSCKGVVLASENRLTSINASTYDAIFSNCEFDCIQRLVINPVNVNVSNCQFYWNDRDLGNDADVALFTYDGTFVAMAGINFNYNVVKIQLISYDVYMFRAEVSATASSLRLQNYLSVGNVITDAVYNTGTLSKYHLLMGILNNLAFRAGSRANNFAVAEFMNYSSLTGNREFIIDSPYDKAQFVSESATTHELLLKSQPRSGVNAMLKAYEDTDGKFLIPWHPMACPRIQVMYSAPFMFTYRNTIDLPDAPDLESMTLLPTYTFTPTQS